MMSEDLRRFLHPDFRTQTYIWLVFQAAVVACFFAVRTAAPDWGSDQRVETGFAPVFYGLAAVLAIISRLQLRQVLADERIAEVQARGFESNASPNAAFARRGGYGELDGYDRSLLGVFTHVRSTYVEAWIMQAVVAILGLVLAIATRDTSNIDIFIIVALGLLMTTRPRAARHLERAARLA